MIYLDNAATTKPYNEVIDVMNEVQKNIFGNPSSLHKLGIKAEEIIETARETIAKTISAKPNEIYFAPSGTFANNTAILGYLKRNPRSGKKVFLSSVEHPSVYNVFTELKKDGYEVYEIPVKNFGLDYEFLEENLDENSALISVMHVNNETGTIFDISKIKEIISKKHLNTVVHSDCVQAYLKLPVNINTLGADLISISAHKIGGPKGIGALYINPKINISPLYHGGGQEKNIFSGTENTAAIAGFGKAVQITFQHDNKYMNELNDTFLKSLKTEIQKNSRNGIPNIINISVDKRSEIALHILEDMGIYVSSGSACSQKKGERNRVLKNFGLDVGSIDTAIRISLSHSNTKNEVLYAAEKINETFF